METPKCQKTSCISGFFQTCQHDAVTHTSQTNCQPAAMEEYSGLKAQTSAQQQTARLIELVLTKGNAAAEVFRNWIQKNDVHLLRDLMGVCPTGATLWPYGASQVFLLYTQPKPTFCFSAQSNEATSPSQDLSGMNSASCLCSVFSNHRPESKSDGCVLLQISQWRSSYGACRRSAPAKCAWIKRST